MSYKILVSSAVLCVLSISPAHGNMNVTQELSRRDINTTLSSESTELIDSGSIEVDRDTKDLDHDSTIWQIFRTIQKLGQSMINKKLTHFPDDRESGTGGPFRQNGCKPRAGPISTRTTDSIHSIVTRPKGSIQNEIVGLMFESMLGSIVESWTVIEQKQEEILEKVSEQASKKKKPSQSTTKTPKSKQSRSIGGLSATAIVQTIDPMQICWWTAPEEKAVIHFKNGNLYEGNINHKCMHGEGRYQWADGTVYLGMFKNNEFCGQGTIQWNNDTWYQGEFLGNLRHGKGLFVDSRKQRWYVGNWHCGTKHGEGAIFYDKTFKNSYDGQWIHNERFGYGVREYSKTSGFKGEWERNIREGKGLMIWPNHDFYSGTWKNGVMSGNGIYIWDTYVNDSMSLASLCVYRGQWERGQRHGNGLLNLGFDWGSFYLGEFKYNKKHGNGKIVTNNGHIVEGTQLFSDDILKPFIEQSKMKMSTMSTENIIESIEKFDICDSKVGLVYHVDEVLKNIDYQDKVRSNIVNHYFENNKLMEPSYLTSYNCEELLINTDYDEDLINFELVSLYNSLKCYERELANIYYKYATICNTDEIALTPILIRLYLWQLYYDCHIHEKGLTLVEIDELCYKNPEWLSKAPHDPFEKIYFWQFLHHLIAVANKLYAKRELPGKKPDTILGEAFRIFMENDILPGSKNQRGRLVAGFGLHVPLKATYALYQRLGEPHTIRTFLCAVRRLPVSEHPQPDLVETEDQDVPLGRNAYTYRDEMTFVLDTDESTRNVKHDEDVYSHLPLFNFGNLSSETILNIFASIFPQLYGADKIMTLDVTITFFEFFEAFIACAEKSIENSKKLEELVNSSNIIHTK